MIFCKNSLKITPTSNEFCPPRYMENPKKITTTSERLCPPKGNKVYFNKPQRLTQLIGANISVIVAGRRTGKTDSIAAPFVLRNMQRMPGSTGGIVVPTFKHGLTNTLPGLLAAWKRWGYIRGVHYVIGRKPPKSSPSQSSNLRNTSMSSVSTTEAVRS